MKGAHKILIVEDEGVIAMNLRRKLEGLGFVVTHVVDNSIDALKSASDSCPDLVMMDIVIQGDLDGIETAQRLRRRQDIPIVFLTAYADESTIERAKSALPYGYLIKPFEERELKTTIEMALYRHQSQSMQRLLHEAVSSATVGIAVADAQQPGSPIIMCNPAFETATGYSAAELDGHGLLSFYGPESDQEATRKAEALLRNGTAGQVTALNYRKDGRTFLAETILTPIRDAAGRITHHLAVLQDVTERVNAERRAYRTQRLEAIGTLVGGVAHDLNNALAPIMMGAQLLEMQYPDASETVKMFHTSAKRGADMVRQLLTFARGAEGERVSVQPARLVKEMQTIISGTFPRNITFEVEQDAQLPTVLGDATQLHQVLLNLCVNARDAMPNGGTLTLEARRVDVDDSYASSVPDAAPGEYVMLRVTDTGTGIPPEILDRIFEPFFTTKEQDKGTGLGLSTVLGIVKGHGGFLQVSSQPGQGTCFTACFPTEAEEAGSERIAEPGVVPFRGHGESILLVDDEAAVREVGREVLRQLNFVPLVAFDGMDGLIQLAEHRSELRAVITDLHMPQMDGLAFVRAFRRVLPEIPVIVASGRLEDKHKEEFETLGVTQYLDKPFTQGQLAEALRLALQEAPRPEG